MHAKNNSIISVITVTYNAVNSIEPTILSIISQTYKCIEYIIIDGGSNDGTLEIIKKYNNKISHWVSEPDKGIYDAMNKGVKIATGDWIYFLGAGDIMFNVLDKIIPTFKDSKKIYYGDVYKLDELKVYNGKFSAFKLAVKNICHQAVFYPSSIFKKYSYNLKYKMQADYDLNMRCYGDSDYDFEYLNVIISIYEGNGISAINIDMPFFKDKLIIIKNNFSASVYIYAFIRNKVATLLNPDRFNK